MQKISKHPKNISFSDFCHDLRTPLTVMKCHIELLLMNREKGLDKDVVKTLKLLDKEIKRMTDMLSKS